MAASRFVTVAGARALMLAALIAGGCYTNKCKSDTALVTIALDAASAAADTLDVTLTIGTKTRTTPLTHAAGATRGTVEVDFTAAYPANQPVTITVDARKSGALIGSGTLMTTLAAGCSALEVDVTAKTSVGPDMSVAAAADLSTCNTIYVSPSGDDGKSGCAPALAVKTIGHALTLGVADVEVCKGTYGEALTIAGAVGLHGGYDCGTWARTASYGYPTFDGTNTSLVQSPNANATITIGAAGVTVDGFELQGPTAPSSTSIAVAFNGVGGTLHDNQILGASGAATAVAGNGSIAVSTSTSSTAATEIFANSIVGGTGTASGNGGLGSVGVLINGLAHVHGNDINGGSGSNTSTTINAGTLPGGSVGIYAQGAGSLTGAGMNAIEGNIISGGSGSAAAVVPGGAGSIGIKIASNQSGPVDLLANFIDGGMGAGGAENSLGVALFSTTATGPANIVGNRIFGGTATNTAGAFHGTVAIYAAKGMGTTIVNNMIHGGSSTAFLNNVFGIWVASQNAVIRHNTIFAGRATDQAAGYCVNLEGGANATIIESNLMLGLGPSVAVTAELCLDQGQLASWQGNANLYAYAFAYGANIANGCTAAGVKGGTTYQNVNAAGAEMGMRCPATGGTAACTAQGGIKVMGNVDEATNCVGPTAGDAGSTCFFLNGCQNPNTLVDGGATIGNVSMCASEVFASFDGASDGLVDLQNNGWMLKANGPCRIAHSTYDDSSLVTTDFYGNPRTVPVSIGAAENDSMSCM